MAPLQRLLRKTLALLSLSLRTICRKVVCKMLEQPLALQARCLTRLTREACSTCEAQPLRAWLAKTSRARLRPALSACTAWLHSWIIRSRHLRQPSRRATAKMAPTIMATRRALAPLRAAREASASMALPLWLARASRVRTLTSATSREAVIKRWPSKSSMTVLSKTLRTLTRTMPRRRRVLSRVAGTTMLTVSSTRTGPG